jgi:hypothetical protein
MNIQYLARPGPGCSWLTRPGRVEARSHAVLEGRRARRLQPRLLRIGVRFAGPVTPVTTHQMSGTAAGAPRIAGWRCS